MSESLTKRGPRIYLRILFPPRHSPLPLPRVIHNYPPALVYLSLCPPISISIGENVSRARRQLRPTNGFVLGRCLTYRHNDFAKTSRRSNNAYQERSVYFDALTQTHKHRQATAGKFGSARNYNRLCCALQIFTAEKVSQKMAKRKWVLTAVITALSV